MGPEKLIVFPDRVTPTGTVPCSDQVTPLPSSLMTPLLSAAPMPLPPNVASLTGLPISAVSWYVWALAGSAAATTTNALPSSAGQATLSARLRLKCTPLRPSVFVRYGCCETVQPGAPRAGRKHADTPASQKLYPYHDSPS